MASELEKEIVIQHAIQTLESLQATISICDSYNALKEKLLADIQSSVEQALFGPLQTLGWRISRPFSVDFGSKWGGANIQNQKGGYEVRLEFEDTYRTTGSIGVKKEVSDSPTNDHLKSILDKLSSGKDNAHWHWYVYLPANLGNWGNSAGLCRWFDRDKFANQIVEEILQIVRIVDDAAVKK